MVENQEGPPPHEHTIEPGEINRRGCPRCLIDAEGALPGRSLKEIRERAEALLNDYREWYAINEARDPSDKSTRIYTAAQCVPIADDALWLVGVVEELEAREASLREAAEPMARLPFPLSINERAQWLEHRQQLRDELERASRSEAESALPLSPGGR